MSLGLDSLNLDNQESKIYVILLAHGPRSIGELIQEAELSSTDVEQSLNSLTSKGYVYEIPSIANRYDAIIPFQDLKKAGEKTIAQLESFASEIGQNVSQKIEIIKKGMEEEKQTIQNAFSEAETSINQLDSSAETNTEEFIAKSVVEIESLTEESKNSIQTTMSDKQSEHKALIADIEGKLIESSDKISERFSEVNNQIKTNYLSGLDALSTAESARADELKTKAGNLSQASQEKIESGIQEVQNTLQNTGKLIESSVDEQDKLFEDNIINTSDKLVTLAQNVSSESNSSLKSTLDNLSEQMKQEVQTSNQNATTILEETKSGIVENSVSNSQEVKAIIDDILGFTQGALNEALEKAQTTLNEKLTEAKDKLTNSVGGYTDKVKSRSEEDFNKVITDTESTFNKIVSQIGTFQGDSSTVIENQFSQFQDKSKNEIDSFRGQSIKSMKENVLVLKQEIQKQVEEFNSALEPQKASIAKEIAQFSSEFQNSQQESFTNFSNRLTGFQSEIENKFTELTSTIKEELTTLKEEVKTNVTTIGSQIESYDKNFSEILVNSAVTASDGLISKTRQLKESTMSVINELSKSAVNKLNEVNQIINEGFQNEIETIDKELNDYSAKFVEISKKNDEAMKNYTFSLEKLASLVANAKHPDVQTAPIFTKEATLKYMEGMFDRLKGGMTLLIPFVEDIPVDLILETKNHQRINLVTMVDVSTHSDLLKKLLQKPNVRVRKIDSHKFEGVEGYLAADRDAEEVLIGVREDNGETIAIASLADSFIVLMGKIVLGDYYLARSQEITRAEVGV